MSYDLKSAPSPRLSGLLLRVAVGLMENAFTRRLLLPGQLAAAGLARYRQSHVDESPSMVPPLPREAPGPAAPVDVSPALRPAPEPKGHRFETAADFHRAYSEGRTTPEEVAERFLQAQQRSDAASPALRAFSAVLADDVLAQARASTERWKRGAPLGPLDGVPVAVKDELDQIGYATTAGTKFLTESATRDATVVERLRAAGALLVGKANMHEIGIDPLGFNLHHGTARNPYDPGHYTGGSSSGSGAAVAAGLVPIAIGADGGGSIRIPAALCGVVGLKATWSRVSEAGAFPLCWSVAHVGPLAATVRDAALAYAVTAGPDARDPNTLGQPPVRLPAFDGREVEGLRIGVYTPWIEHAQPAIVETFKATMKRLEERGARIVEIEIPDLELGRLAHAVTILSEMASTMDRYDARHRGDLSLAVRLSLVLAREFTSRDYVRAQQVRTRLYRHFERAFEQVDVIATPSTAMTAPAIGADAVALGESNLDQTGTLMRYAFASNLTGHPAISVPAGYDAAGLPIGVQGIGRPWEEHTLLSFAAAIEQTTELRTPKVSERLLPSTK